MSRHISTKGMKIKDWLKIRKPFIGASEISAAIGLNPYRTSLDLWREKSGDPSYKPFTGNNYTKWGYRLESSIAWGFAQDYKFTTRRDYKLRIHDNEILSCSIDRLIIKTGNNGILEIKNMSEKQFARLLLDRNDVSMMYYSQVQQQFDVSGLTWGYFVILVGGNTLIVKKTYPDKKFIAMQSNMGVDWWNDYIIQNKPPEPDRIKYQALKDLIRRSSKWQGFRFTPEITDEAETDPVKIFIREVEAANNRTDLNKLIESKSDVITKAKRENQSLINTVIKVKHLLLRKKK